MHEQLLSGQLRTVQPMRLTQLMLKKYAGLATQRCACARRSNPWKVPCMVWFSNHHVAAGACASQCKTAIQLAQHADSSASRPIAAQDSPQYRSLLPRACFDVEQNLLVEH